MSLDSIDSFLSQVPLSPPLIIFSKYGSLCFSLLLLAQEASPFHHPWIASLIADHYFISLTLWCLLTTPWAISVARDPKAARRYKSTMRFFLLAIALAIPVFLYVIFFGE